MNRQLLVTAATDNNEHEDDTGMGGEGRTNARDKHPVLSLKCEIQ